MGKQKFDRGEARRMMESGLNNVVIAEKLGVSKKTIHEYRKEIGLPPSTMRRKRKGDMHQAAQKARISADRTAFYPTHDGNKKCTHCVYRMSAPPYTVCGYILATGRSRSLKGIPFGKDCTLYAKGNPEDIVWKTL